MHTFNAIDKDRYGLHTNCIDRDTLIFLYVINVMKSYEGKYSPGVYWLLASNIAPITSFFHFF